MKDLFLKFNHWIRRTEGNETALHFLICFLVLKIALDFTNPSLIWLSAFLPLPIIVGYIWEYLGKKYEGKTINKIDIKNTALGGFAAMAGYAANLLIY